VGCVRCGSGRASRGRLSPSPRMVPAAAPVERRPSRRGAEDFGAKKIESHKVVRELATSAQRGPGPGIEASPQASPWKA